MEDEIVLLDTKPPKNNDFDYFLKKTMATISENCGIDEKYLLSPIKTTIYERNARGKLRCVRRKSSSPKR